jgi:ATP-dependent exoDNAse (exonuclease V) alpha subunit
MVNGSMGTITSIEWPMLNRDQLKEGDLPESVLIEFDDKQIASKISFLDKVGESVRIKAHNCTFEGKKNTHITRRMFPFILSWAVTIHKTQGLTIEKAVISLAGCFAYNMEYVALSRIKTLKGLAILNIDLKRFNSNKFTCPESLLELGIIKF